jgi:cytochrome c553
MAIAIAPSIPRPAPPSARLGWGCALLLLAAVAAPHLMGDDPASPAAAPEAPGCVGCHHGDATPIPEGLGAEARRTIAGLAR